MKKIDFPYFIERYNSGEMSESEKQWFLKEIEGNEGLRSEVEMRRQTDAILKNQNVMSLRSKLADIEAKRSATVIAKRRPYLNYAAAVGGLLIVGSLIFLPGGNVSTEKIMQEYYKPYDPPTTQRAAVAGTDGDFTMALEFYKTKDYERAAALFSKVLESRPGDMQVELLNGVSKFEEKKYPEAKQSFGKVIDDKNNLYIDQAQWYLALCYLNTNETEKAKQLLTAIEKEDGIYKKEARKIIRGLK